MHEEEPVPPRMVTQLRGVTQLLPEMVVRRRRGPTERLSDIEPPKPRASEGRRETVELTPELMGLVMSPRSDLRSVEAKEGARSRGANPWKLVAFVMLAVVVGLLVAISTR